MIKDDGSAARKDSCSEDDGKREEDTGKCEGK